MERITSANNPRELQESCKGLQQELKELAREDLVKDLVQWVVEPSLSSTKIVELVGAMNGAAAIGDLADKLPLSGGRQVFMQVYLRQLE